MPLPPAVGQPGINISPAQLGGLSFGWFLALGVLGIMAYGAAKKQGKRAGKRLRKQSRQRRRARLKTRRLSGPPEWMRPTVLRGRSGDVSEADWASGKSKIKAEDWIKENDRRKRIGLPLLTRTRKV